MKNATTGKTSKSKLAKAPSRRPHGGASPSGTDWKRLRQMSAAEIHRGIEQDPDAQATDEAFWKDAKVVWPARKEVVTMRLDADLLEWFRGERGYQTRINAILRAYMQAQNRKHP